MRIKFIKLNVEVVRTIIAIWWEAFFTVQIQGPHTGWKSIVNVSMLFSFLLFFITVPVDTVEKIQYFWITNGLPCRSTKNDFYTY